MPATDLTQAFHSIIDAIAVGDLEELDHYVRYDIVDHNAILGQGDGRPGLKYWAKAMRNAFPDLSATVADTLTQGNKVAARVRWAGTHAGHHLGIVPSHRFIELESFYILRFEAGMAVEWWDGSDMMAALAETAAR